jgi:hypothetical protein
MLMSEGNAWPAGGDQEQRAPTFLFEVDTPERRLDKAALTMDQCICSPLGHMMEGRARPLT